MLSKYLQIISFSFNRRIVSDSESSIIYPYLFLTLFSLSASHCVSFSLPDFKIHDHVSGTLFLIGPVLFEYSCIYPKLCGKLDIQGITLTLETGKGQCQLMQDMFKQIWAVTTESIKQETFSNVGSLTAGYIIAYGCRFSTTYNGPISTMECQHGYCITKTSIHWGLICSHFMTLTVTNFYEDYVESPIVGNAQ